MVYYAVSCAGIGSYNGLSLSVHCHIIVHKSDLKVSGQRHLHQAKPKSVPKNLKVFLYVAGVVSSVYIASPLFPAVSGLLAIPGIPNFAAAAAEEEDHE